MNYFYCEMNISAENLMREQLINFARPDASAARYAMENEMVKQQEDIVYE